MPSASRSIRPSAGSGVSLVIPASSKRRAVDPGAVVVAVGEVRRPVATRRESRLVRCGSPPGNADICQQAPVTQALSGLLGGIGRRSARGTRASVSVRRQVAGQHHPAALHRMDVRVLEAGDRAAARRRSTTSVSGTDEVVDLCRRPRRSDRRRRRRHSPTGSGPVKTAPPRNTSSAAIANLLLDRLATSRSHSR